MLYGANEREIEVALNDLPTIGQNGVTVTGLNDTIDECFQYNVTFSADFGR